VNGVMLVPSLNRSGLMEEYLKTYVETEATMPGLILVDEQDPQLDQYKDLELPKGWEIVVTKAVLMGDKIREVWSRIIDLDYVALTNDDHKYRTKHWDRTIISQIRGYNVVATNDGPTPDKPWNAPKRIAGAICFSGPILRTLGWMFPPGLQHLYSDDAWAYLFGQAECCNILMDVCVEHDHAYKDASKRDSTFEKVNGDADWANGVPKGGLWDADRAAYTAWLQSDAPKDLQKIKDLQPRTGVMIATPSHDHQCAVNYAVGLADVNAAFRQLNIFLQMARVDGSSLLAHARNSLVDMFLKSKCQKLMFIDADQGFVAQDVLTLLNSSRRVIAGVVPHKRYPINLNFVPKKEHEKYFKSLVNKSAEEYVKYANECADKVGEVEVEHAGTGFMMIDRSVFEMAKDKTTEYLPFDGDEVTTHQEYFKMGVLEKRYKGEDWWFNHLVKELSIPIYIQTRVMCPHTGTHTWRA